MDERIAKLESLVFGQNMFFPETRDVPCPIPFESSKEMIELAHILACWYQRLPSPSCLISKVFQLILSQNPLTNDLLHLAFSNMKKIGLGNPQIPLKEDTFWNYFITKNPQPTSFSLPLENTPPPITLPELSHQIWWINQIRLKWMNLHIIESDLVFMWLCLFEADNFVRFRCERILEMAILTHLWNFAAPNLYPLFHRKWNDAVARILFMCDFKLIAQREQWSELLTKNGDDSLQAIATKAKITEWICKKKKTQKRTPKKN